MFKQILSLIGFTVLVSSCTRSSFTDEIRAPRIVPPSTKSVSDALVQIRVPTAFKAVTTKVRIDSLTGDTYGLFQLWDEKRTASSILMRIDPNGHETEIARSAQDETIIDFDANGGKIILLRSQFTNILDPHYKMPCRELMIEKISSSVKSVLFFDPQQTNALIYDKESNPRLVKVPDPQKTVFFVANESVRFAGVAFAGDKIFLATTGAYGNKVYSLNQDLSIEWGTSLRPRTDFREFEHYASAPKLSVDGDFIFVASVVQREEIDILRKHLNSPLPLEFEQEQGVLAQRVDLLGKISESNIYSQGMYFTLTSIKTENEFRYILGNIITPDGWRGSLMKIDSHGRIKWKTELSPFGESSFNDMFVRHNEVVVGGDCGSRQVRTGSVVEYADACLLKIDSEGKLLTKTYFGTARNDGIVSMDFSEGRILLGGYTDGPVTHTADNDASAGFQKAFFGLLKP